MARADDASDQSWSLHEVAGETPTATPYGRLSLSREGGDLAAYAGEHPSVSAYGVFLLRYRGSAWAEPEPVDTADNTTEAPQVLDTSVARLSDGAAAVAYSLSLGAGGEIRFARLPAQP